MIREDVAKRLKELLNVEDVPLNVPPDRKLGDFSSAICLSLAKQKRRPPMEIARETADQLKSRLPPFILQVAVTPPGYLNFSVDWPALTRALVPQIFAETEPFREVNLDQVGKGVCRAHERQSQQGHAHRPPSKCRVRGYGGESSRLVRVSDGDLQLHRRHGGSSGRRGDSLPLPRSASLQ